MKMKMKIQKLLFAENLNIPDINALIAANAKMIQSVHMLSECMIIYRFIVYYLICCFLEDFKNFDVIKETPLTKREMNEMNELTLLKKEFANYKNY